MTRILPALALCVIGIGCSNFDDESVTIVPPAPAPAAIVPGAPAVGLSVIAVDKRVQLRDRIASKAGAVSAKVTASNDVVEAVRQAVEQEFQAEGFALTGGLVLTVEVENFYALYGGGGSSVNGTGMIPKVAAQVAFTLRLRDRAGTTVAVEHYEGSATRSLPILSQAAETAKAALEEALSETVARMREDRLFKAKLLSVPVNPRS